MHYSIDVIIQTLQRIETKLNKLNANGESAKPKYLRRNEAAKYLRVSLSTIDRLVKSEQLTKLKVNTKSVFELEALDNYLTSKCKNNG